MPRKSQNVRENTDNCTVRLQNKGREEESENRSLISATVYKLLRVTVQM